MFEIVSKTKLADKVWRMDVVAFDPVQIPRRLRVHIFSFETAHNVARFEIPSHNASCGFSMTVLYMEGSSPF